MSQHTIRRLTAASIGELTLLDPAGKNLCDVSKHSLKNSTCCGLEQPIPIATNTLSRRENIGLSETT